MSVRAEEQGCFESVVLRMGSGIRIAIQDEITENQEC